MQLNEILNDAKQYEFLKRKLRHMSAEEQQTLFNDIKNTSLDANKIAELKAIVDKGPIEWLQVTTKL